MTNDTGTFLFDSVEAGSYVLTVIKTGYLSGRFGQQSPSDEAVQHFDLLPDESVSGVVLPLWEGGQIAGTVRNLMGSPLPNRWVQLMELRNEGGTPRIYVMKAPIETDASGGYAFEGIGSGRYLVRTSARPLGLDERLDPSAVYYPGPGFPDRFSIVKLNSAERRSDVDITVPDFKQGFRISGRLIGLPVKVFDRSVKLVAADADSVFPAGFELSSTTIQPDGTFVFSGIPSGQYQLRFLGAPGLIGDGRLRHALRTSGNSGLARSNSEESTVWVKRDVTVTDASVNDLMLPVTLGLRAKGKISLTSELNGLDLSNVCIEARSLDGWNLDSVPVGWVEANGTFTGPSLPPGRYLIRTQTSRNWFVESVLQNGRDITETGIDLGGADLGAVNVTLSSARAEIKGRVTDKAGNARSDASVLFLRTDLRESISEWRGNGLGRVRTNRFGDYSLPLTPGSYLILAVVGDLPPEWTEPSFMQPLLTKAAEVTVSRSAVTRKDLEPVVLHR